MRLEGQICLFIGKKSQEYQTTWLLANPGPPYVIKKKPKMSNFVACPKQRDEHGMGAADEEYFNQLHGYSSGMCYSSQISWSFKKHLLTKSKRPDMTSVGIRHDQKLTNETKHTELMWQFQCHLWLSYIHTAADNGITLISYKSVKG